MTDFDAPPSDTLPITEDSGWAIFGQLCAGLIFCLLFVAAGFGIENHFDRISAIEADATQEWIKRDQGDAFAKLEQQKLETRIKQLEHDLNMMDVLRTGDLQWRASSFNRTQQRIESLEQYRTDNDKHWKMQDRWDHMLFEKIYKLEHPAQ